MTNHETQYGRYCDACAREHGPLYVCPSYDDATKAELKLRAARVQFRGIQNFYDREWMRDFVLRLQHQPDTVRIRAIGRA